MQFKDSKYMTMLEKHELAKAYERFLKGGLKETQFSKKLYKYLSLNFGFIAHFNKDGFFGVRFDDPRGRLQTYHQIVAAQNQPWQVDNDFDRTGDLNHAIIVLTLRYANVFTETARMDRIDEIEKLKLELDKELSLLNQ